MNVQRGDVVLVSIPFSVGQGAKVRPAVVIQCDRNNARLTNTVLATVTGTIVRATYEPTQVLVEIDTPEGQSSGLLTTSAITCENIHTIRKEHILRIIGRLSPRTLAKVDAGLKESLGLQ